LISPLILRSVPFDCHPILRNLATNLQSIAFVGFHIFGLSNVLT
jgi:hypothetical protein